MSATTSPATSSEELRTGSKEDRLRMYLRQRTEEGDGEIYFKSKFIADDVDLSSKEIGALMLKLRDTTADLSIEKWSYTSATTWRVTST
jgi:hypothetical protein